MTKRRPQQSHEDTTTTDRLPRGEAHLAQLMDLLVRREQAAMQVPRTPPPPQVSTQVPVPAPVLRHPSAPLSDRQVHPDLVGSPEPRRQRKQRQMKPRKVYRARVLKDPKAFTAIRNLTPAASAILVYLTQHGQGT